MREVNIPELVLWPHHELSYHDETRKNVNDYTIDEIKAFDKQAAVDYARAGGFIETGMSPNEVGLLYELLEEKSRRQNYFNIVELGRNFGCSTRMFLQHVLRHGGTLHSWDLKHWGNLKETFINQGFHSVDVGEDYVLWGSKEDFDASQPGLAHIRIADSMKTHIKPMERWVDFLLVDTEHGLENALGEYMRWRQYLRGSATIAFHDSELDGPRRAIEMIIEIEADFGGRLARRIKNERIDGFGLEVLEWKG